MGQICHLPNRLRVMTSTLRSWLARSACPFFEQSRCQSRQLSETDVTAIENAEKCRADREVSKAAMWRCGESATPRCCESATHDAICQRRRLQGSLLLRIRCDGVTFVSIDANLKHDSSPMIPQTEPFEESWGKNHGLRRSETEPR